MKKRVPLESKLCGFEEFNFQKVDEIEKFNINHLHCVINPNYTLKGDYYSDDF